MGLAVGDYRNNGLVDLYTGTFSDDYKSLFRNDGDGNFTEITPQMGIAEVTYPFLTWSTEFIDYDNDGWKDIIRRQWPRLSAGGQITGAPPSPNVPICFTM